MMSSEYQDLRVVFINLSDQIAGIEQVQRQLNQELSAGGASVMMVTMAERNGQYLSTPGKPAMVIPALADNTGNFLVRSLNLRKHFRPFRGQTINLHYPMCDLVRSHIVGLKLAGCKSVYVTFHHPFVPDPSRAATVKSALDMCKSLMVTTKSNAKFVIDNGLVNPSKVKIVPPGIEAAPHYDKASSRASLGLPADAFIVGTVCRLAKDKRVELAMEACAQADPKAFFALAGAGSELEPLRDIAEKLLPGRHAILGRVEETARFYSSIDAFVLLSELEGFGLVYSEAANQSVPSIGCRTGGTPDAILDGETGFLVDVDQPIPAAVAQLKAWIQHRNQLAQMGQRALDYTTKNFTREAMTASFAKVIREGG